MPRSKTITLKGEAARAFIESHKGTTPKDDNDALARIATRIHMEVHAGNMAGAVSVLKLLQSSGIQATTQAL